jgi:hypothetical protein
MPDEEGGEIVGDTFGGPPAQREPRYGRSTPNEIRTGLPHRERLVPPGGRYFPRAEES